MISKPSTTNFDVAVVCDIANEVTSQESVTWAVQYFLETLKQKNVRVNNVGKIGEAFDAGLCILVSGPDSHPARRILQKTGVDIPAAAESFSIVGDSNDGHSLLLVIGADANGLVYAILELVDRLKHSAQPLSELQGIERLVEKPATPVRSINRLFVNEIEDKPWFYDKTFWADYLTELATHRFNRFHLALGMGYDYGHDPDVNDNYFCFAYPFLFKVPGYDVKVAELTDEEMKQNLEMLRYIGDEAKRRGLHFQLGLWNHSYIYTDSPNMNYTIDGITPENHAAYSRDAVRLLLETCPAIDGVTFRVHYEGGIPEPTHDFWKVVMEGVANAGRKVEIDMHPKGVDDEMLQLALNTEMPVTLSPKFWAEHMGLPYHQTEIREREKPDLTKPRTGLMAITATNRRFTRYGYADYLKEERSYGVLHRIWPGTQRVLLWGDPEIASGLGRCGTFCESLGIEFCEPLTFKARKGSGSPGGRDPYVDEALQMGGQEWSKYLYTYRIWGRLLYNPDADPHSWKRYLQSQFGEASAACEEALAHASRILPLITVAHGLSAANNIYWPEMYYNLPIVKQDEANPYHDTAPPGTFGSISPFDPALFYRIDDFADDIIRGERSGKYSPLDVANRLENFADSAERHITKAHGQIDNPEKPSFRRWAIDVSVLAGIGRFFANKFRAGLAYSLYERLEDPEMLKQALTFYREAQNNWMKVAEATTDVYREDITFGYVPYMRGHWADRLKDIEEDVSAMTVEYDKVSANRTSVKKPLVATAVFQAVNIIHPAYRHYSPLTFKRGESIPISIALKEAESAQVRLHYRKVNQEENYQITDMSKAEGHFTATIPAAYTDSPYPLIYFFELYERSAGNAWIVPGFDENLSNQPYYALRQE
jgi:hypothetical protein